MSFFFSVDFFEVEKYLFNFFFLSNLYSYETSNGISHNQEGQLKNAGSEQEAIDVHGEYSYTDPQTGKNVKVVFTADESGYRPHTVIS